MAEHPLQTYLRNQLEARDLVRDEIAALEELAQNSPDAAVQNQANIDGSRLNELLGRMEAAHDAFMLQVYTETSSSGPSEQVVAETLALNIALAKEISEANRAVALVHIITSYLNGAISVFKGQVPAAPPDK